MFRWKVAAWLVVMGALLVLGRPGTQARDEEKEPVPVNALCLDQYLPANSRVGYIAAEGENVAEFTWLQYHLVPRIFEPRSAGECTDLDWVVLRGYDPAGAEVMAETCGLVSVATCGKETVLRRVSE